MSRGKWKNKQVETVESQTENVTISEPQELKESKEGIICSRCRFPMRVCRTKPLTGAVYRVRVCDRCGHKKTTTED